MGDIGCCSKHLRLKEKAHLPGRQPPFFGLILTPLILLVTNRPFKRDAISRALQEASGRPVAAATGSKRTGDKIAGVTGKGRANRVGGASRPRPPTPPCVLGCIRRFHLMFERVIFGDKRHEFLRVEPLDRHSFVKLGGIGETPWPLTRTAHSACRCGGQSQPPE
jgi:hypothetical protein